MPSVYSGSYHPVSYTSSQLSGLTPSQHSGRVYFVSDLSAIAYSDGTNWIYTKPVNSLTAGGVTSPLSAEQGKNLATRVTTLEGTVVGVSSVYVFQSVNDGVTDEGAALQAAVTANRYVLIPANTTVCVSRQIVLPSDTILVGAGRNSIIKALGNITLQQTDGTWPQGSNGESGQARCMVKAGHRCQIKNLAFNGNNFKSGGVMVWYVNDVLIEDVWVYDAVGTNNNDAAATSAVNATSANRLTINRLNVKRALYGGQFWLCNDVVVCNSTHDIGRAGFWTAGCNRVMFSNLRVADMNDVGLDFEGGSDCYCFDSSASSCGFGELALFNGNLDGGADESAADFRLQFINCVARRTATFINYGGTTSPIESSIASGALFLASVTHGSRECGWYGCKVTLEAGIGFFSSDQGARSDAEDWEVEVVNCTFVHRTTTALFRISTYCRGMRVVGNTWTIDAAITQSAVWKNPDRSVFADNRFYFNVAPTATDYVILVYQDAASLTPVRPGVFARNWFGGPESNHRMVKHQANHSTGALGNFIYENNTFSQKPVAFGGLYMDSGGTVRPMFRNQKFSILITRDTGAATELVNIQDTANTAYMFGGSNQQYMPHGSGIIHVREYDTATGAPSSSNQNVYPFIMSQGGGMRLFSSYDPLPNGAVAPGGTIQVGTVTLDPVATTTNIVVPHVASDVIVLLSAQSAAGATVIAQAPGVYHSATATTGSGSNPALGSITLTHGANLGAGVTLGYEVKRVGTPGRGSGSGVSRSTGLYLRDQGTTGSWFSQYFNFTKSATTAGLAFQMDIEMNSPPRFTLNGAVVEFQ